MKVTNQKSNENNRSSCIYFACVGECIFKDSFDFCYSLIWQVIVLFSKRKNIY